MADLSGDFRFLAESARRFVDLLAARQAFERVSEREKRERGAALVRHVDHTAGGIETRISETEAEFATALDDIDREEAIKKIRLLAAYAHFMRRALPWLEAAKNPPLDLGVLYFIDQLAAVLIRESVDVVPTRADEYSTEQRPFQPLFARLKLGPEEGPRPVILNFPALETNSFPLLPVFGHEVAHTAIQASQLVSAALWKSRREKAFNIAVRRSINALAAQRSMSDKGARIIINERLEDWIEELLCDQLAMQYLGPSFLLALSAYLIPLSWNGPGPRHPPTTVRVAHLLACVERTPWEGLLEKRMPATLRWLKQVAATPPPTGLKVSMESLLEAIDIAQSAISEVARDHLGDNVYNPNDYLGKATHLDELLRHEVLPVQHPTTEQAFEARAILMAGWLSMQDEAGKDADVDPPVALSRTLRHSGSHMFFTKALEMSSVLSVWSELE